ncbi:sensor histidine kinase [Yoonia sediminilitoris]|uniref:histidine kinase n=1 Tax=Yoonia sediminilitoris TaxID=1286148 RepID=A0A2T6KR31_9RHOB|nr:HAMP domain-containing sensor histidine kinase [Yoonia sediminilitoris]PUB19009.1 histidine kinase/DNA gyrase B/HSP90-like ATPase [Yoonia sediminilitoris]RCW99177.1 histidine kinase/DNA gyrase B/HSP90-like ATPase [Yoonia sediminilitoris]
MAMNPATQAQAIANATEQDALEQTIYLISHDLMAPARAIATIPDWIDEDLKRHEVTLPTDVQESFDLLKVQGVRLQAMIADLLIYSRIGRKQTFFNGHWDPIQRHTADHLPELCNFTCDLQLAGHPVVGSADIQHLVIALLSNAVKHHDRDRGTITVATQVNGLHWQMTVTDDGPGIPPGDKDKVCQLFTTLKARDMVEGSGMGLAIVEKICLQNGGCLSIDEGLGGKGCQITVILPISATPSI